MSGKRKRLYYRLTPVFEPEPAAPPQVANASVVTCMATGKLLDGGGGGGLALSTEVVDALDGSGENPGPKLILSTDELETIRRGMRLALIFMMRYGALDEPDEIDSEARTALEAAIAIASPLRK